MARWTVASCVVVIICAQHALGHAEEAKPVAAATKPTAAVPTATAPTATAPKNPKKPRKRAAAEQDRRLFERSKEGRAFAELLETSTPVTNILAGADGVPGAQPLTGGLGAGWGSVHATKCCGADQGVAGGGGGVGGSAGTGKGFSGVGVRVRSASTGSVSIKVRGLGQSPPAVTAVQSKLKSYLRYVLDCAQSHDATLASTTTLQFSIDENTRVSELKATGDNQVVVDCVAKLAVRWRLPVSATDAAPTRVEVTFTSTP
ncbi:MAG: hypothetical protein KBG15_16470 [Kofleriaceae bacterium]|nr:hypothetical protein [Kofleriaceae bacterium]